MSQVTEIVHAMAGELRDYATHFAPRDWDYTRDTGDLKHIRYRSDYTGYNRFDRRLKRFLKDMFWKRDSLIRMMYFSPRRHPWITFQTDMLKEKNVPDGVLDNGNIITHWEETGEYLQYVQPTVGALIADLMDAHPDLPEIQTVALEMKRINDRYAARIEKENA